ncbi:MAG: electron transfer flavoprotein subunit beta/FixA family protein [Magnetococcales bacterium]|nr:electron transfer flavoprotein subunit beta/FixA family protein [Magnetococcales bacterium]
MKILVALKPVRDPTQPIPLTATGEEAAPAEATQINPFDELALEAALRLREAGAVEQIGVVSVGPAAWENHLRTALAMGADQACLLQSEEEWSPLAVARGLAAVARHWQVDLLLCGRQTIDHNHNQTGPMAAALLGWGQMTHVSGLALHGQTALVEREWEGFHERWSLPLPAVVTVDWRLNGIAESGGVRYASLPNLLKARRKPLQRLSPAAWHLAEEGSLRLLGWQLPEARPAGQRVATLKQLLHALQQQGVLPPHSAGRSAGEM